MFDNFKKKYTEFKVYYCNHVKQLVEILTDFGKTKDSSLQHDVFKHIFAWVLFKDKVEFEKEGSPKKIDIYHIYEDQRIEVKTINELSFKKLKDTVTYVFRYHPNNEKLWVFYFLKLEISDSLIDKNKEFKIPIDNCKYLLIFISIIILGEENLSEINSELEEGVEEIVDRAAEKLDVEKEIIIPLGNVIISEELRRKLKEKEKELESKEKELESKKKELESKKKELESKEKELKSKEKELEKERKEKEKYIKELIKLKEQLGKYRKT
ncbi:MAG: hypothetical protein ACTSQO_08800 [Candidatus Helarchaeota archaeon]